MTEACQRSWKNVELKYILMRNGLEFIGFVLKQIAKYIRRTCGGTIICGLTVVGLDSQS